MLKTAEMRGADGQRIPFSITFVTCDLKKNEGGNKIHLSEAVLVGGSSSKSRSKNPNHYENYTRNIRALNGDRLIKIHPLLVTQFSGLKTCQ
ncbi:MAG: hypothetical protein E6Q66_04675 [Pedobacter sp.]|nr:MAG: hypothetical protein E6Q66_04675 [Pedobacter sp.]